MRFHRGNLPNEHRACPENEGWQELPPIRVKRLQNYGLLVGCGGMLLVSVVLRGAITPSTIWGTLAVLLLAVPLHELTHALSTPGLGLTDRTVIGWQRDKGLLLPYMYYDGIQPLWRFLFTGVTPTLLLTVLPLIFILFAPLDRALRADLGFLAVFNIAIAGGDLVNFVWVLSCVPLRAIVQLNGWSLMWRMETGHGS